MTEIPHILHQSWFGGEARIPPVYRAYRVGWRRLHPGWTFRLWDEAGARELVATHYPEYLALYDGYPHRIQRIDACRYFILHQQGGVYADLDVECLKPIDELLAGLDFFISKPWACTNAVMGSAPGHRLWPQVFAELVARRARPRFRFPAFPTCSRDYYIGYSTGPLMITAVCAAAGIDGDPRARYYPGYVFEPGVPYRGADGRPVQDWDTTRSHTIHHMDMHWLSWPNRVLSRLRNRLSRRRARRLTPATSDTDG